MEELVKETIDELFKINRELLDEVEDLTTMLYTLLALLEQKEVITEEEWEKSKKRVEQLGELIIQKEE